MELKSRKGFTKVAAVALLVFPITAQAVAQESEQSIAGKINAANQLIRQNENTQAIDEFNRIGEVSDKDLQQRINYNLAVAHYRNSDFAAAQTLFTESAASADDRIAADSRYNLGNCHYASALPLTQQQPDQAINKLKQAIQSYHSALRLDRNLTGARKNLELAVRLIQQLEQQKQNQQQEQEQDQQQNQQNQQSESDNQQSADSKASEKNQPSEQNQSNENQSEQNEGSDQQGEDQDTENSSSNTSNNQKENTDPSPSNDSSQEQQTGEQQPTDNNSQQDADQKQNGNDDKKPPQGDITAAQDQENEPQTKNDLQATTGKQEISKTMTRQEALKMLQAVRDRDMLRRLRQQQRQKQRRVKVDKDW